VTALLTAQDIAERYNCTEKTARNYMHKMEHMEKPLRVTAEALEKWELDRTMGMGYDLPPVTKTRRRKPVPQGRIVISKVREKT